MTPEEFKRKLKGGHAAELKDLDVDRVDGVDRPATGRNFLLFKSEAEQFATREEWVAYCKKRSSGETNMRKSLFTDIICAAPVAKRSTNLDDIDRENAHALASAGLTVRKDADATEDQDDVDDAERAKRATALRAGKAAYDETEGNDESKRKAAMKAARQAYEDGEMDSDEAADRGILRPKDSRKFKVSFKSILGDGNHDVGVFPIEEQDRGDVRGADRGTDALSRGYSDEVLARLGGGQAGPKPEGVIPDAGLGATWNGTTQDITYALQRFTEGDGRVGQEPRRGPFARNMGKGPGSYDLREDIVPEGGAIEPVSLPGGMRIMSPQASGIADAARAKFPGPLTDVLKSVPRRTGLFRNLIAGLPTAKGE